MYMYRVSSIYQQISEQMLLSTIATNHLNQNVTNNNNNTSWTNIIHKKNRNTNTWKKNEWING